MSDTIYHDHLGVYSLIIDNDKILLIKKARGPYLGMLDLPGGGIETHETIEEALFREINEEVGCDIQYYEQLACYSTYYNYSKNNKNYCLKHIGIIFQVIIDNELKLEGDGKDSQGCIWMELKKKDFSKLTPMALKVITEQKLKLNIN